MRNLYLLIVGLIVCLNAYTQAPPNDDPCNAPTIPVNATCVNVAPTNENATASAGVPAPGCANYAGGDVWLSFVVPSVGTFTVTTDLFTGSAITDGGLAIYSGTCSNLTLIACDDDSNPNNAMSQITATRPAGETIWIRLWEYGNNAFGRMNVCVTAPLPPTNEDPCTASPITAQTSCSPTTGTTLGASGSTVPSPGCAGYAGGDVWYSVIVPAGGSLTISTDVVTGSANTDDGIAVYSGSNCNSLTLVQCDDNTGNGNMGEITLSGRTPGETLWVRVWENGNNANGQFIICVIIPPPMITYNRPCYSINAGNDTLICTGSCSNLALNAVPQYEYRATTEYRIEQATMPSPAYNVNGTNIIVDADDVWGAVVPINFNFCYFGNTYNSVVIGANGLVSFNTAYAGAYCPWSFTGGIPDAGKPINSIFGPYLDIDPSVGFDATRINYYYEGTAPCRRLVVNFNQIPMFSSACNNLLMTSQIVLHEAYNIIDIILYDVPVCSSWNGGRSIVGIQNANGTLGYGVPGLNPSTGSYSNKCYRFVPNGALSQTINWYQGATQISANATASVCPTMTTTYTAQLINTLCNGQTVTVTDDRVVTVSAFPVANATAPSVTCGTSSAVLSGAGSTNTAGTTYTWSGPTPSSIVSGGSTLSPTVNASGDYILTVTSQAGCIVRDTVNINFAGASLPANAGPDLNLNCTITSVSIGSSAQAGASYAWSNGATTATQSVNAPNTYTVTVTNTANGCTTTDQVQITQDIATLPANAGNDAVLTCTTTDLTIGTVAQAGASYAWSNSATTATQSVNAPNTYTVTVTNTANGCTTTDQVQITQNIATLPANAGNDAVLTCTTTDLTIGTIAQAGASYAWSNSTTTATQSVNAPNTYTVTVTNTANGCTTTDQVQITQDIATLPANAGNDAVLTCTTTDLTIGTIAQAGASYAWSNSATTATQSVNAPNTYTVTVTNTANGCTTTDQVQITQDIATLPANAGNDAVLTCTTTDLTIGTVAQAGASYAWSNGATTATQSVNAPNTYTVTVTNTANGCTTTDQVQITQDIAPLPANAGNDAVLTCTTTDLTIGTVAQAGASYAWSNSATTATQSVNAPNTYTVTVTNTANGCTTTDQVQITQNIATLPANAGNDAVLTCTTTDLTIGTIAQAGASYAWSNSATTATQSVNAPNTYTVTVTNTANGCTTTDQVQITQDIAPLPANAGNDAVLTCTTTDLTIGTVAQAGASYAWSNSATTATQSVNAPNTYTVTVTNTANGCTTTDQVQITQNIATLPANAGNDAVLTCTTTDLTIGTIAQAGASYAWSNGATTATQSVNAPNTYTVTVTNTANGCTTTDQVQITQDIATLPANAGNDAVLTCTTTDLTIGTIAQAGASYAWSNSATTATQSVNAPNTYTVTVTNTANGCTTTDQVQITQNIATLPANAGNDAVLTCTTTDLTIGTIAQAGASYAWSNSATTATQSVNAPNTYTVTVTNTANGCTTTDQVQITQDIATLPANAGNDAVLTCTTTDLTIGTIAQAGASYAWSNSATTATQSVNAPNTYTVTVTNTANGCTTTDQVQITQDIAPLPANAGNDAVLTCTTTDLTIGTIAQAGASYAWSNSATTATQSVNAPNTYTVTVTNTANGCTTTDQVQITQDIATLPANAGNDAVLTCTTTDLTIGTIAQAGASYAWSNSATTATQSVNAPNTYTVTVTNTANGCTTTDQVQITQDIATLPANAGNDAVLTCTTTDLTIGTIAQAGASYAWSNSATTATQSVNAPNTYTVTVTNTANGCTTTDQVQITQDIATLPANAGNDAVLTCTTTDLTIGTVAQAGASYAWSNSATTATQSVNAPNTYTVTVTNTANGCTTTDQVQITQDIATLPANAGNDAVLTCTTTDLTIGTVAQAGASYAWSNSATTATQSVNAPNTYTVTVTNTANGCTTTDQVQITQDIATLPANAGNDAVLTCTTTDLTIGTIAQAGASYAWSNSATTATQSVNAPNTYTVTVTNTANGCTTTDQVQITQDIAPLPANAGNDAVLTCTTTDLTIGTIAQAGASYAWSNSATTATQSVNAPNTYTVTVTNTANGCTTTDQVQITQDIATLPANAGNDAVLTCTTTDLTIGTVAQAGASYAWSNSATTATQSVNAPNTYTVTVTNTANGCTTTDQVQITQNIATLPANAGADQQLTCTNPSTTLNGAGTTIGATIQWNTATGNIVSGASTLTPTVDREGIYILTVTNITNGCTSTDQVEVTSDPNLPQVIIQSSAPELNCNVSSIQLDASGSTYPTNSTLTWAPSANIPITQQGTPIVDITQPGLYTLTIRNNANGCIGTSSINITRDNLVPIAEAGTGFTLTCATTQANLDGTVGSSQGPRYIYRWTGANITANGNTLQPTVNAAGLYTLVVTDTINGCTASDTVRVLADPNLPRINAGNDTLLTCVIRNIALTADPNPAPANYSIAWTTADGNITGSTTTLNTTVNRPGRYVVTITNLSNGCSQTDEVLVTENITAPIANAGSDRLLTCNTPSVTLDGSASRPQNVQYQWTPSANILGSNIQATAVTSIAGTYTLIVTDPQNGCTANDAVLVNETPNSIRLTATSEAATCYGAANGSVRVNVQGGTAPIQINWNTPHADITAEVDSLPAGTYVATVSDANGCVRVINATVTQPDSVQYTLRSDSISCYGYNDGLIALTNVQGGTPPLQYSFDGRPYTSSRVYDGVTPGVHTYSIRDANGCIQYGSVDIYEPAEIFVYAGEDVTIGLGDSTRLNAIVFVETDTFYLRWYPYYNLSCDSCLNPIAKPFQSTLYEAYLTDANGCKAYDQVRVNVDNERPVYIPSGFTPNGDGVNDWVTVYANPKIVKKVTHFAIYDRWGEKVYEGNDFAPSDESKGWDGYFKGKVMNPQVFVYSAEVEFIDGKRQSYKGDITLIR